MSEDRSKQTASTPAPAPVTHQLFMEKELAEEALKNAAAKEYDAFETAARIPFTSATLNDRQPTALSETTSLKSANESPEETAESIREFGSEVLGEIKSKVDSVLTEKEKSPPSEVESSDFVKLEKPREPAFGVEQASEDRNSVGQSINAVFTDIKEKLAPAAEVIDSQVKAASHAVGDFFKKETTGKPAAPEELRQSKKEDSEAFHAEQPLMEFGDFLERKMVHPLETGIKEVEDNLLSKKSVPEKETAAKTQPSTLSIIREDLVEHPASKNFPVYDEYAVAAGKQAPLPGKAQEPMARPRLPPEFTPVGARDEKAPTKLPETVETGVGRAKQVVSVVERKGHLTKATCSGCWIKSLCDNEHRK
ncbi:unnamed protein product [Soboliphyme baturini]|uniref:Uncharacterized protein n=1 Tax=Soboliphyme baturini TaxID=241478 RepID=A0A183IT32_9BILA|nr:unnamed protein product [Soboliphyme baturini]